MYRKFQMEFHEFLSIECLGIFFNNDGQKKLAFKPSGHPFLKRYYTEHISNKFLKLDLRTIYAIKQAGIKYS